MLSGVSAATQDINVLGTEITAPDGARLESRRFKMETFRKPLQSAKRKVQREKLASQASNGPGDFCYSDLLSWLRPPAVIANPPG